jgi:mono/diheme cytochrome c family protein
MAGLSTKTAYRAGAPLPLILLGLLTLPGCGDSYPKDLNYTARTDPIVEKTPDTPINQIDAPGQLEQWIDSIPAKGGQVIDPTAKIEKAQLAQVEKHLSKGSFDLTEEDKGEMGLASLPSKEDAKAELEKRRDSLKKRIDTITSTMKTVGPKLDAFLKEHFGTPAEPKVDVEGAEDFQLDPKTLAEGSKLYRRHCLHCHGLTGDGRGPTGPWVNPHPRDYRQGQFKFTSTTVPVGFAPGSRKARRDDLLRTLKQGIEGTSMPSFALLDEEKELQPLISYVIHLSMRGQVEREVLKEVLGRDRDKDADIEELAGNKLESMWNTGWKRSLAQKQAIEPADIPSYTGKPLRELSESEKKELDESIRRGFTLFTTGSAECLKCHTDFGRANNYKYDEWGTIIRPANLTAGIYRGGRRPIDLYYRIHSGINGAAMPAYIHSPLTPKQIWDIVNFLEALPYKKMLPHDKPGDVQEQIYGKDRD